MADARPLPRFGTFRGVFTPTLLTILGVIMYLRLGWVVGQAGLVGAVGIILLAVGITTATGLSLSSIATNTRLGAGGPYGIISRSLGLEVGGSVGVPLYLSQALAVAMYVFGFREGWLWLFPEHPALVVDLALFAVIFALALRSADLAFKIQYGVLALIAASLVSIALGGEAPPPLDAAAVAPPALEPVLEPVPPPPEVGFWATFAVFFPAVTGVMAGANMSGELTSPRRNIPRGTLSAIAVSAVVYLLLAVWAADVVPQDELLANYTAIIDYARWRPVVLAGLLGATASSALTSLVGAPRILQAMGAHGVVPRGRWLARRAADGEPRRAMVVTGLVAVSGLLLRDLNAIAPLITMFFLITYAVVNLVVLVEGSLGLTSFRPTLRVPLWVPLLGLVGCVVAMFIVNPAFSLAAVVVVLAIHATLLRRGLVNERGDVRSSLLVSAAEWAATRVTELGGDHPRSWRPNVLAPVEDAEPGDISDLELPFLLDLCRPEGSVMLLGLATDSPRDTVQARLDPLGRKVRRQGVFCSWSSIDSAGFSVGVATGLQALQSALFRPNVLFLRLHSPRRAGEMRDQELRLIVDQCRRTRVGVLLLALPDTASLASPRRIRLWIRPQAPDWDLVQALARANLNLAVLCAWRLQRTWGARLRLVTVVPHPDQVPAAQRYLADLCEEARLPPETGVFVEVGDLDDVLARAEPADLDLFGLPTGALDPERVRRVVALRRSPCLFLVDSGRESAQV